MQMISNKRNQPENTKARRLLSGAGRRTTRQRSLILDVLAKSAGHLDADEVYRLARERDPRLSLSTVYRTLNLLRDLGQVDELHLAEEHHHYEARGSDEHHHLVCLGCGKVLEFVSPMAVQLRREQESATGFVVTGVQVDLTGYCPQCQANAPTE
jgi:Fur family ferric uptake transcriptional regulator